MELGSGLFGDRGSFFIWIFFLAGEVAFAVFFVVVDPLEGGFIYDVGLCG